MFISVSQLKKLRGRSLREWRVRGTQQWHRLTELLLPRTAEMSDDRWLRKIVPADRNCSGEGTAALLLERLRAATETGQARFLPAFNSRAEVVATMAERFSDESAAIVARAERICAGRFALLGYDDLRFGDPPNWHLEPLAGKRTPLVHWSRIAYLDPQVAGDKKLTWELNRHGYFITLGQAYWLTGDERYAEVFASHVSSWMDANPPALGINWASSLEVAFRAIAWLWAIHLFAASPQLTPQLLLRMHKYLAAHGRHLELYLSEYFSPNTHLTGEALGLLYLGVTLPEVRRALVWRERGLRVLLAQLPLQVRGDGVYFEQTTYYHRYTTDFYLHLLLLSEAAHLSLPALVRERLTLMLDHLMWLTRPDGTAPLVGDDDSGRLVRLSARRLDDFRDTLAAGAALFQRGDWKAVAGEAVELLWLLGPEGLRRYDRLSAQPPGECTKAFPEGGFYVMRDGWERDDAYVLIDGGPHGALSCAHAHADALSLEFAALGTAWLTDSGTCTYTGDAKLRDLFRSTQAHNTVTVDGISQSEMAQPFTWRSRAQAAVSDFGRAGFLTFFAGSHDGYERLPEPVTHERTVILVRAEASQPAYLIVRDSFAAAGRHHYAIRWHFPPGVAAFAEGRLVRAETGNGRQLRLSVTGTAGLETRIERGQASRAYGQREETNVAVFEAQGSRDQTFTSVIIPSLIESAVTPDLINIGDQTSSGFRVCSGTVVDVWRLSNGGSRSGQRFAAAGAVFCERYICGQAVQVCLLNGHELKAADGTVVNSPQLIRYCALRFESDQIEIAIDGVSRFVLTTARAVSSLIINGQRIAFDHQPQHTAMVFDGAGWQAVCA
ncbi:MAG TPA: alginate lyase family protein [Blastocatellia bacterium]|nr:alginate lyase family protein [Blastocatellia bacterium]